MTTENEDRSAFALENRKRIAVLHHNDADGFGAAFAAWYGLSLAIPPDQVRPEMKFIAVQYPNNAVPEAVLTELAEFQPHEVYIVDFSYKRDALLALQGFYPHLVVIDHHRTAMDDLAGLDFCLFDMNHSGCALAWDFFVKDIPMPTILAYVEDRDLWKFELLESKAVNAYISTLKWDFMEWLHFNLNAAVLAGDAILNFQKMQLESRVKAAVRVNFSPASLHTASALYDAFYFGECEVGDYTIPIVNATENISELGDALAEAYPDAPFTMSYCDRPDGKRSYSLRSRNGFDVSAVAKAFGGGGHPGAAGFTLDAPRII